jgi:hypothetical protein
VVEAETIGAAWKKLIGDKTEGFAPLASYVRLDQVGSKMSKTRYITPEGLDNLP